MVRAKQLAVLVILAAIWGASFLLMRVAAPEFGAVPLIGIRVSIAALSMLPFMLWRGATAELNGNWGMLAVIALTNAAIPFSLFAYATLSLTAGFTSVLNSLAPMFTALIGFFWLRQHLSTSAVLGLVVGVIGVALLAQDKTQLTGTMHWRAAIAGIAATALYGFAANFTKEYRGAMSPIALAGGHLFLAGMMLLPVTIYLWPDSAPSTQAWIAAIVLAVVCTGLAHILYFWLLQEVSAHSAVSVTFMIPMFGMFWGYAFMGEHVSLLMMAGCAVILFGVALTIGLLKNPWR